MSAYALFRGNSPLVRLALICFGASRLVAGISLDTSDQDSIKNAAKTIATNIMSNYGVDLSSGSVATGLWPNPPYFWWESGGAWGAMIDYWAYSKDDTWRQDAENALYAQSGPNQDLIMPSQAFDEGNDDQGFWALSVASAFEYDLPATNGLSYPNVAAAAFEELASRWNTVGMQQCGGGLKWQFTTSNKGYDYKSTISQGAFFQLAARLARYTGNSTYADWATKIWDWTTSVGLIGPTYRVYDGTNDLTDCKVITDLQWSYNTGIFLYGCAVMYKVTGDSIWQTRTEGFVTRAQDLFFTPYSNSTGVMYEIACELIGTCETDQLSFKAYLARWMAQATDFVPSIADTTWNLLEASAKAAAQTCVGGTDGTTCGQRWWVKGYDGSGGLGEQLSALEVIQALLLKAGQEPAPTKGTAAPTAPTSFPQAPSTRAPSTTDSTTTTSSTTTVDAQKTTSSSSTAGAMPAATAAPIAHAALLGALAFAGGAIL